MLLTVNQNVMTLVELLQTHVGLPILSKKEQLVFLMLKSSPDRRDNRHPKQQSLPDRNTYLVPRHDLRPPLPPRQVRLCVGEGLFGQEAPLF